MHTLKLGKLIYCDTSIKNKRPILAIIIVMAIWITASTMTMLCRWLCAGCVPGATKRGIGRMGVGRMVDRAAVSR